MARWFRSHASKLNKTKVLRLSDKLYRAWDCLLCVACEFDGVLPPLVDTALLLRKSEKETQSLIDQLVEREFFVVTERGVEPHQWNEWQYRSDVSTERVKQHRERQRNVSSNVSETPSESETEADTESKEDNSTAKRGADKRGTRLPEDWKLSAEDRAFAADLGLDPDVTADEFRDYWTALPGARGRKLDWSKTFRNRCREIAGRPKRGSPVRPTMQTMPADDVDQWRSRLRDYTPGAFWPSNWGPRPGEPGCFVPAAVLAEFPQARTQ